MKAKKRPVTSFHYLLSRSDCFSSDVFVGCMDTLLVENEARMEAAALVDDIHSYY